MKRTINSYYKDNLVLRLLNEDDLGITLLWRNYEAHRRWFVSTEIISTKTHFDWFYRYSQSDEDFIFIICNQHGTRYGQLSIYEIDWMNKCAIFGRFLVNPDFAGLGIMKKACRVALLLSSEVLKLNKLTLEVKTNNKNAIHIYQSNGFSLSGFAENEIQIMQIALPPNDVK